jgi:hypothetical protein
VGVDTKRRPEGLADRAHRALHLLREGAAVGVAQAEPIGTGLVGRPQAREGSTI